MREVTRFETIDGTLHKNRIDAKRHAELAYSLCLSKAAGEVFNALRDSKGTVAALGDLLDKNLNHISSTVIKLIALKNDSVIEEGEDDEG